MRTRVDEILEEQKKLAEELALIQDQCPHPPLVLSVEYKSSGGHYDRETHYWKNLKCGLCLKSWREDQ